MSAATNTSSRRIYLFSGGKSDGHKGMKQLVGGVGKCACSLPASSDASKEQLRANVLQFGGELRGGESKLLPQ
jgi:hypothetical protein